MQETKNEKAKISVSLKTDLSLAAGVHPAKIAIIDGDTIFINENFGVWDAIVDIDSLPSWGDVRNPREYYLGNVTYIPEIDENGDTKLIEVNWGSGYLYLTPLAGVEVER